MGLGSSKESLSALYAQYAKECFAQDHGGHVNLIRGGAEGCVGGLESLGGYDESIMSKAKRQLIKDIASDLANRLKVPGVSPKGKSLDQVIAALRKTIPDPRQKGSSRMTGDKAQQEKTCRIMGQVINERMGDTVVNLSDPPAAICDQVAEVMYSLFTGIHGEFVAVRDDVKRIMKNLDAVQSMLEKNFAALEGRLGAIQEEEDANIAGPTKALRKFHKDLLTELKRQRTLLKGMTNTVIEKSDADLAELLKESGDFNTLVKKIKAGPGSPGFSEKLAAMLSGVRTVAESAHEVESALKKLGISQAEYAKLVKGKDLKRFLNKSLIDKLDASEGLLREYRKAADAIYKRHYMHDDIVKSMSGRRTGAAEGENSDASEFGVDGGSSVSGGLKLDKRVRKREELRRDLLRMFNQQMGGLYNDMSSSIKAIASAIGAKKVDLSDETEDFIRALDLMPDIGKKYTYFALTGYHDDIKAKEERERFIATAKYLHEVTDALSRKAGFSGIAALGDLKKTLQSLVDLISRFYKRFSEGFGILEADVKSSDKKGAGAPDMHLSESAKNKLKSAAKDIAEGGVEVVKEVSGAAEGGKVGDLEMIYGKTFKMAQINRVAYDFRAAKDSLIYDFRTAKIRSNLTKLPAERKAFAEDYTRVVGDAIARAVDEVNTAREAFNQSLADKQPLHDAIVAEAIAAGVAAKNDQISRVRDVKKFGNEMFDAKISMYRTAEALEHYMNAFSDGIASHPDDLQDVVGMLNNVEIISKWHNNESGDAVASVFEVFPSSYVAYDAKYSNLNGTKAEGHYYQKVVEVCGLTGAARPDGVTAADDINPGTGVGLPGNPFLAVPSYRTDEHDVQTALDCMDKALQVNPLKNVVSVFINIGSKFGNVELIKKTHMSPIQIYRALLNYIKYSSLAMGVKTKDYYETSTKPLYDMGVAVDANVSGPGTSYPAGGNNVQLAPSGDAALPGALAAANPVPVVINALGGAADPNVGRVRLDSYVSMAGVGRAGRDSVMNASDFDETDKLYQMCIKAMVSKVLTAIGVFNMFNRPVNEDGLGFFSGLRLVLGGDSSRVPQVIPEALELYVRLPLLAEFYRKIFNFDAPPDARDFLEISLVPEMSGTFSGLINIIFDRAKYVTEGNYGESDTRALIEEINKIWARFRSSKNPTNDILDEFIAEVNRRYGVLKRSEREAYLKERDERYDTQPRPNYDDIEDFELAGLDEDEDYARPAPSQSYQTKFATAGQGKDHKYKLSLDANANMLRELRMTIDRMFAVAKKEQQRAFPDNVSTEPISFANSIRARKQELKHSQNDEERYQVVANAINSFGAYALSALDKSLIMFHEVVVNGLTTLGAVGQDIVAFKNRIEGIHSFIIDPPAAIDGDETLRRFVKGDPVVAAGTQGAPADINMDDVIAITNAAGAGDKDKAFELAQRFLIDQDLIMRELFEALYAHTQDFDKLVELDIQTVRDQSDILCSITVNVSHGGLIEQVKNQLAHIRSTIDKMRGLLPQDLLDKYEQSSRVGGSTSLYDMEQTLYNEVILGKARNVYPLDRVNAQIADIIKYLTRPWKFDASAITGAGPAWYQNSYRDNNNFRHQFPESVLNLVSYYRQGGAVAWDAAAGGAFGSKDLDNAVERVGLYSLLANSSGKNVQGVNSGSRWPGADRYIARTGYSPNLEEWDFDAPGNNQKSVWLSFNKLVADYLKVIYDSSLGRVYETTLNKFANGAYSNAVFGGKWYPDMAAAAGINLVPSRELMMNPGGVLFQSLAIMIRQLVSEPSVSASLGGSGGKRYLESDLAEIPLYMKERLKANLPVMRKLFHLLSKRCDLLQKFAHGLNLADGPRNNVRVTTATVAVLDEINRGCRSLIVCINETLEELNDDPKFMQLRDGFIEEYKAANGKAPFMPMSSLTFFLKNRPVGGAVNPLHKVLEPIYKPGDDKFKMLYGARGIINSDPELKDLPGMLDILKAHNQSTNDRHSISESDLSAFVKCDLRLLRYALNADKYKLMLSTPDAYTSALNLIADNDRATFQAAARSRLEAVIALTESAFQKDQKQAIATHTQQLEDCNDFINMSRDAIIVYNIIDINKVPINFAALMREMPMVNLLNYSYTFDRLVMDMLGLEKADIDMITKSNSPYSITLEKLRGDADAAGRRIQGEPANSGMGGANDRNHMAARLMGLMLMFPYDEVEKDVYDLHVSRIIRGDMGIEGLGRPAYIGDEIYNKALFNEIYPGSDLYEEQGPSAVNIRTKDDPRGLKADGTYGKPSGYNPNALANHNATLSFMVPENNGRDANLTTVNVGNYKDTLQAIGRMRFDTKFVRNLFWITNIQRLLRLRMRRDLTWFDSKIVSEHAVLAPAITEQYGNQNGPLVQRFMQ